MASLWPYFFLLFCHCVSYELVPRGIEATNATAETTDPSGCVCQVFLGRGTPHAPLASRQGLDGNRLRNGGRARGDLSPACPGDFRQPGKSAGACVAYRLGRRSKTCGSEKSSTTPAQGRRGNHDPCPRGLPRVGKGPQGPSWHVRWTSPFPWSSPAFSEGAHQGIRAGAVCPEGHGGRRRHPSRSGQENSAKTPTHT